jgi:hypothetical protein
VRGGLNGYGDLGMLIVPPATEEFALATAISTCGNASDRVGNIKVPKLKSCIFIDTLSSKKKLKTDMKNAESYIEKELPKGFKLVTAEDVYSSSINVDEFGCKFNNTLKYVSSCIENKYSNVQCIFVMLDSVIFCPNNFQKTKFDEFLAWASEIKKQGKTLVVISQYQIPQTKYLADHMNFVINCIPDQRGAACGLCAFAFQWLSLRLNLNVSVNTDSEVDSIADLDRSLNQNQSDIIQDHDQEQSKNPHFSLMGYIGNDGKRGWSQAISISCISNY